jgi:inosine-uridine nucleoside N-ribohydrolase
VSVEASWQGLRVGLLMNNLAAAETKSPGILKKSKESAIVGGTFFCCGKVTPHAEFNILFNAEAAQRVFDSRDDIVEKDKSPS